MAGIYLHIPFCKKKCHYCDFHFSTNFKLVDDMVEAICHEAALRSEELQNECIETIYFGGGTPSVLSERQLAEISEVLKRHYQVSKNSEITLEANPDDLSKGYLKELWSAGINRLSVGIQSFDDEVLTFMNRSHQAIDAINSIKWAKNLGFQSISIDLIYGLPNKDLNYWKKQVKQAVDLGVNHVSAYCLTIEPNTVFSHQENKGLLNLPNDQDSLEQFEYLIKELRANGFEHYEISNFAKPNGISKHNAAYWLGKKYTGLGPSAHSYNGVQRSWNIRSNPQYIKAIKTKKLPAETEDLTPEDQFNDYILTRLRTKWGLEKKHLNQLLHSIDHPTFWKEVKLQLLNETLIKSNNVYQLSEKGKFIADRIAANLFV